MIIDIDDKILTAHKKACISNSERGVFNKKYESSHDIDGGRITLITTNTDTISDDTPNKFVYNAIVIHDSTVGAVGRLQRKRRLSADGK